MGRPVSGQRAELEQAIRTDPALERCYFRPKLPKPGTPFESLFLALKLMPEDVMSSDWVAWSRLLETLAPRERFVLERRLGLAGAPRMTLRAVGTQLRITREWVRQLQQRAQRHLRKRAVQIRTIEPCTYRGRLFPLR